MAQLDHADSKFTLRVYMQVMRRGNDSPLAKRAPRHGRGWVRTSDLSRVKGDEEVDNLPQKPRKKQDPGDRS
jgi:hypothetical protein